MSESRATENVAPQASSRRRPDPPAGYFTVVAPELARSKKAGETFGTGHPRAVFFILAISLAATATAGALMIASGIDGTSACTVTSCASEASRLTLVSQQLQPGALAAETTPGERSAYFSPAVVSDPSRPGRAVLSGPDAPDPFVLVDSPHEYLYTSNGSLTRFNVPSYTLETDGRWGDLRDALPRLPQWAIPGFTWAPDVRRVAGGWALYFTAAIKGASPSMECIGDAFGSSPLGPFKASPRLFICQASHRGSIDPRTFVDPGGSLWMYWKSDDNANPNIPWTTGNGDTGIWAQRLSPDGRTLLGKPKLILRPTLPWEGTIVEAPDMLFEQGRYWMFYSGGWFNSPGYAIGAARCASPIGPCAPTSARPLLESNSQGAGPGEPSVFENSAGIWILYNPWASNDPRPTPNRPVVMARLGFTAVGPYVAEF
jgi:Glycosyl hydrolases family 43